MRRLAIVISAVLVTGMLAIVAPTAVSATCDYSHADQNGGWGYDHATGQSCPPTASDVGSTDPATQGSSDSSRPICRSASSDPDRDGFGWENNQTCVSLQPVSWPKVQRRAFPDKGPDWYGWVVSFSDNTNTDILGWKITREGGNWTTIYRNGGQSYYEIEDKAPGRNTSYGIEPIVAGGGLDYSPRVEIIVPATQPAALKPAANNPGVRQILANNTSGASWRDNAPGSAGEKAVQAFDVASEQSAVAASEFETAETNYDNALRGIGVSGGVDVSGEGITIGADVDLPLGEIYATRRDLGRARVNLEAANDRLVDAGIQVQACTGGSGSCSYTDDPPPPPPPPPPPTSPGGCEDSGTCPGTNIPGTNTPGGCDDNGCWPA